MAGCEPAGTWAMLGAETRRRRAVGGVLVLPCTVQYSLCAMACTLYSVMYRMYCTVCTVPYTVSTVCAPRRQCTAKEWAVDDGF